MYLCIFENLLANSIVAAGQAILERSGVEPLRQSRQTVAFSIGQLDSFLQLPRNLYISVSNFVIVATYTYDCFLASNLNRVSIYTLIVMRKCMHEGLSVAIKNYHRQVLLEISNIQRFQRHINCHS